MCVATSQKARKSYIDSLVKNHVDPSTAENSDYGLLGVPHQKVMVAIVGRVEELHRKLLDESSLRQNQFNFKEAREFNLETLEPDYSAPEATPFDAVFENEEDEIRSPGKLYSWSYTGIKKYLKSRRNSLDYISDACNDLSKWKLEWGYREKGTTFNASATFLYEMHEPEKGSSVFKFRLHAGLEKMAILNKNFTCISVDQLKKFDRSSASLALYRICSRYAHNGVGEMSYTPWYSPEQWKDLLFIPHNKYPTVSKLKEKVLDRSAKIINVQGELDIEYESEKKRGNRVTAIRFKIVRKESLFVDQSTSATEEHFLLPEEESQAEHIVSQLLALGVSSSWLKKWIYNSDKKTSGEIYNALGFEELLYNVIYLQTLAKEKSINGGYCVKTLQSKLQDAKANSNTASHAGNLPIQQGNTCLIIDNDTQDVKYGYDNGDVEYGYSNPKQSDKKSKLTKHRTLQEDIDDCSWAY